MECGRTTSGEGSTTKRGGPSANIREVQVRFGCLLPTGSEEREVLGVGSISVALHQNMNTLHHNCIDMNKVG